MTEQDKGAQAAQCTCAELEVGECATCAGARTAQAAPIRGGIGLATQDTELRKWIQEAIRLFGSAMKDMYWVGLEDHLKSMQADGNKLLAAYPAVSAVSLSETTQQTHLAKYGHEPHCNLMFPATLNTDEDFCNCKSTEGKLPRCVTVHDHFDVPSDPTSDDGKATIAAMLYYQATGEVLSLSVLNADAVRFPADATPSGATGAQGEPKCKRCSDHAMIYVEDVQTPCPDCQDLSDYDAALPAPSAAPAHTGQAMYEEWMRNAGETIQPRRWIDLSESTRAYWNKRAIYGAAPAQVAQTDAAPVAPSQTEQAEVPSTELLSIGGQMSNVMYNLAQHPGQPIGERDRAIMCSLRRQWDAARKAAHRASSQKGGDK